jgi:hypothetical protein
VKLLGLVQGRQRTATPRADDGIAARAQRLFWGWAVAAGLALFVAWWMQTRGLWQQLVDGDPSGISLGITALAVLTTLWCGRRCAQLQQEAGPGSAWRAEAAAAWARAPEVAAQLIAERCHGPHETAWWFASAAIKLGLLGTVVGFIVMAAQIGAVASFEFDQIQSLLKQMTGGMAIALYTTLVGLVANLWLGLQLMLMDRVADRLAADLLARAAGVADAAVAGAEG